MGAEYPPAVLTAARRLECEIDGLYFFRYFFKVRALVKALINWHHAVVNDNLQLVIDGQITRLIIAMPPGYTKTEMAAINFMARGLAINPRARFLHLSYSDTLAMLNSSQARAIVKTGEYQSMWPREMRDDTDRQNLWWTQQGGGVYATSIGGQVTGFRAGHMEPGFTGALIIDDPLKPDDVLTVERKKINEAYNNTIQSRLAHEGVPIIVIMQRLHHEDLAGYLLKGGSGEKWHYLELPVDGFGTRDLPADYTHAIPIEYEAKDTVLWRAKHDEKAIETLAARPRLLATQYRQRPPKGNELGALWTDAVIEKAKRLSVTGQHIRTVISIDPSVTSKETSDECGIIAASKFDAGSVKQYQVRADYSGVMKPDAWARMAIMAYEMHDADAIIVETNNGGDMIELTLQNCGFRGRVIKVHAKRGKFLRAEPVAPLYTQGLVSHLDGLGKLEAEMLDFSINMAESPNRVDALVYALQELSGVGADMSELLKMAIGANKR